MDTAEPVDASERLRRRYRRLLWAYPNWYRRERGLEILSTLLEGSRPGQRRPSFADALDIVGRGLRCRFRPPTGLQYVFVTVVAVLFLGSAGAATLAMTYAATASVPSEREAVAAARLATGQTPRNPAGPVVACTYFCPEDWRPDGDQVVTFDDPFEENGGVDHVSVVFWTPAHLLPSTVDDARERLAADGWQVDDLTIQEDGTRHFGADKDGLTVQVAAYHDSGGGPALHLRFERQLSDLTAVAVAGFVAGTVFGWTLTVWILQRYRRHQGGVKAATTVCAVPILVVMGFTDLLQLQFAVGAGLSGGSWESAMFITVVPAIILSAIQELAVVRAVATVILALAVVALALAAAPIRAHRPLPTPEGASRPGPSSG
ncbi:hypothetical protein AB0M43_01305 [Longispora sp. NPDC051575]|uniref:hypothetical protein n=1 Tax=Longispora sp. NPDC051575 TaxID=3154943 RepID=UPI0034473646